MTTSKVHPALKAVEKSGAQKVKVAVSDIDGILRGKYLHIDKFKGAAEPYPAGGFGFCGGEKVPPISKAEEARLRAEAEKIRLEAEAKAKAKAGGTLPPTAPVKKEAQGPFLTPEQRAKLQPQKPKNTGVTASGVKYRR